MTAPSRTSRLPQVLLAFVDGGPVNIEIVRQRSGIPEARVGKSVSNAASLGFIERNSKKLDGKMCYQLTERGRAKLQNLQAALQTKPVANNLAEQALAALGKAEAGLDSDQLAQRLAATADEIDAALALHVANHQLVTCGITKFGEGGARHIQQYRLSVGGVMQYGWRDQQQATWMNHQADQAAQMAAEAARGANGTAPAPGGETLRELVEVAVREVDIDAVHRTHAARHPDESRGPPAAAARPLWVSESTPPTFRCALFSDGCLWIACTYGHQLLMRREDSRKLIDYLDRVLLEAPPVLVATQAAQKEGAPA